MAKQKVAFNLILVVFLLLSFWLFSGFIVSIIIGAFLTYLSMPLYHKITFIKNKEAKSLFVVLLLLMLLISLVFLSTTLAVDKVDFSIKQAQKELNGESNFCNQDFLCSWIIAGNKFSQDHNLANQFIDIYQNNKKEILNTRVIEVGQTLLATIPQVLLQLFVIFFSMYYFMANHESLKTNIVKLIPLPKKDSLNLFNNFKKLFNGLYYGFFITAIIQSIIASIVYFLIGIESSILLGILTGLVGIIPIVGTGLIWIPILAYTAINAFLTGDVTLWQNSGILLVGGLIISSIDNLIKPKVMSDFVFIDAFYILLSVFGGLLVFGASGIILGPIILIITNDLLKVYMKGLRK